MSVDNTTNLNISNTGDIFKNQDINDTSAPTKTEPNPVNNNTGITEISDTENDFITTFSGTPKPSLREPDTPLAQFADKPITVSPEMAEILGIESKEITLSEFLTLCSDKIKGEIGNLLRGGGGKSSKLDSEILDCMVLLITMDSKSKLIQTLRDTLQAKIKDRAAKNQQYLDKTAEADKKNAEEIKKAKEAEARQKRWGIIGAVFSAIAAAVSCFVTVATFGAAAPVAALAIAGCVATCAGSICTSIGLATGNEDWQKAGMWLGIAGAVLSLASGVGSIFTKAVEKAPELLKTLSIIANFTSGVTNSTNQIVNGVIQLDLAESQKELANIKIELDKLNKQIELLSDMIDKIANSIQNFMKDLFQDEEEVAQMVQQMMNTNLSIEQNVKC